MSLTMERLPTVLMQQYNELPQQDCVSKKEYQIEYEDFDVIFSVSITRLQTENLTFSHKVFVKFEGLNWESYKLAKLINEHFFSQTVPDDGKCLFDSVELYA